LAGRIVKVTEAVPGKVACGSSGAPTYYRENQGEADARIAPDWKDPPTWLPTFPARSSGASWAI
jgi:hypothetical protein